MDVNKLLEKIIGFLKNYSVLVFFVIFCIVYSIILRETHNMYYLLRIYPSYPTDDSCST